MPIDPSIADLSWLTQSGDAGTNLAKGAAVGAHVAQFRAQNASLAERAQEFQQEQAVRERQLAIQVAQAPFHNALLQQEAAFQQAHAQSLLDTRDAAASAGLAFAALQSEVNPLMQAGKIDEAQNAIIRAGASNAWLLADPEKRLHNLFDMTTKAQDSKLELLKAKGGGVFTPIITPMIDPRTRQPIPDQFLVQTGPHQSQILDVSKDRLTKEGLDLRARKLQNELPDTAKAELKSIYKEIDAKKEKLDALSETSGMPWNRQPNPKRAALQAEIDALREKAQKLAPSATAPNPDERIPIISPDGTPGTIKRSQLSEALGAGYKQP